MTFYEFSLPTAKQHILDVFSQLTILEKPIDIWFSTSLTYENQEYLLLLNVLWKQIKISMLTAYVKNVLSLNKPTKEEMATLF